MTKFISVTPLNNYILHVVSDEGSAFNFDVSKEIKHIPSYEKLYDIEFFKKVHFRNDLVYCDHDHDFHIDQVLAHKKSMFKIHFKKFAPCFIPISSNSSDNMYMSRFT